MTLIVNMLAGPGAGKSTIAAGLFAELKLRNVNAELVTEYAKDRVWEEAFRTLDNQIYMFAKQHHRIWRVLGKVDVVVTDSPMLLSLHYGKDLQETFRKLVLEEHLKTNSLNVCLERKKPYQPIGRVQTEDEAKHIDWAITGMLKQHNLEHIREFADHGVIERLADRVQGLLA
jgi:hypothetical protein